MSTMTVSMTMGSFHVAHKFLNTQKGNDTEKNPETDAEIMAIINSGMTVTMF